MWTRDNRLQFIEDRTRDYFVTKQNVPFCTYSQVLRQFGFGPDLFPALVEGSLPAEQRQNAAPSKAPAEDVPALEGKPECRIAHRVDLHGFTRQQAPFFLRRVLMMMDIDCSYEVTIIVGRGLHVNTGAKIVIPRLAPKLCELHGFAPRPGDNPGQIAIFATARTEPIPLLFGGHARYNMREFLRKAEQKIGKKSNQGQIWTNYFALEGEKDKEEHNKLTIKRPERNYGN
jgi:hypothetical protein